QLNEAFASVFEKASPSVVVIRIEKAAGSATDLGRFPEIPPEGSAPFGFDHAEQNEGSGFLFTKEGHIFTNNHVIEGAETIRVRLLDGRSFDAEVVGVDEKTDIAVIKISAEGVTPVELANSDELRVGHLVCAIGAPYNLDYTFTFGCVSAKGRSNFNVASFEEYIQTDASINPGNSGGPLLDLHGRVVGMTTLIHGINRGLGFAIPSSMLKEVGDEILAKGRVVRPWLGLGIEGLNDAPKLKELFPDITRGVVVRSIAPRSPAYKSDIRPGDIILSVDGREVGTTRELQKAVLARGVGQNVQLRLNRSGKEFELELMTEELPDHPMADLAPEDSPSEGDSSRKK
ncbi:MAG: trypsin-like peptidase domain-containing protein, partial [Verrucomicrobiia bacterium]